MSRPPNRSGSPKMPIERPSVVAGSQPRLAEAVDAGKALGEQADEQGGGQADHVEVVAFDAIDEAAPSPWMA